MVVWLLCTYTIERKLRGNYWTCCKTLPEIFLHEHCSWCWRQIERLRYICTFFSILCPPHNLQGGYTESWWVAPTLTPNPISPLTFLRENSEASFSQICTQDAVSNFLHSSWNFISSTADPGNTESIHILNQSSLLDDKVHYSCSYIWRYAHKKGLLCVCIRGIYNSHGSWAPPTI